MGEACFNLDAQGGRVRMPVAEYSSPGWYAVQTGYRCEQRVALDLTMKGFKTYLPLLREIRQWTDRRKITEVPAFSGYLFVHCEPSLRNRVRVLETGGIVRLLGGNHAPSQVSEREIEDVRRTIESGVACAPCDALTPGALVKVTRGALAGVHGRLARIKNSLRLVITITAFAQAISAELGFEDVEAVTENSLPIYSDQRF